jgi:hypothetical protein
MADVSGEHADAAEDSVAAAFQRTTMMNQSWPDTLSDWTLVPPSVPEGEGEPVRVFETAEAALAFLSRQMGAAKSAAGRPPRYLKATATR